MKHYITTIVSFILITTAGLSVPLYSMQPQNIQDIKNSIAKAASSDISTLGIIKNINHSIGSLTPEGRVQLLLDPKTSKQLILLLQKGATTVLLSDTTQKYLKAVALSAIKASLGTLALATLSYTTGNIRPEDMGKKIIEPFITQLLLNTLVSVVKAGLEGTERMGSPAALTATVSEYAKTVVSRKPLSMTTGLLPAFSNIITQTVTLAVDSEGGWGSIVNRAMSNFELLGPLTGPVIEAPKLPQDQVKALSEALEKLARGSFTQQAVRNFMTQVLACTVQGATIAIIAQALGIGYWFEPTLAATATSAALAGAAEGAINYFAYGTNQIGFLDELSTAVLARASIGQLSQIGLSPAALTSFALQEVISNISTQFLAKGGLTTVAGSIKSSLASLQPSQLNIIPARLPQFVTNTLAAARDLGSSLRSWLGRTSTSTASTSTQLSR